MAKDKQVVSFDIGSENRFINQKHSNVSSDLIEITKDKLENILYKHLKSIETSKSYIAPLGICIATNLPNITATFNERFFLSASKWENLFLIAGVVSFIWLLYSLFQCWKNRGKNTIDYLVNQIKASDQKS